jgi:hypothetical protein
MGSGHKSNSNSKKGLSFPFLLYLVAQSPSKPVFELCLGLSVSFCRQRFLLQLFKFVINKLPLSACLQAYNKGEERKMEIAKNKSKATLFALFLTCAMAVSLVALPNANAQSTKATYAFIGAVPNPVGVGQDVLLAVGITESLFVDGDQWHDLTVTVKTPSGKTETLGPFDTDSTGATGTIYVPKETGNYTLQTHFPAQWYNTTYMDWYGNLIEYSGYYKASDSEELTLVVTDEPVEYYPGHALPTEYWTRPIDSQLREWCGVSGSWLYDPDNRYAPYNDDAPDTAHILWTTALTSGGLVGGDVGLETSTNQGAVGFGIGDAYEGKYSSRFIISGKLYYVDTAGGWGGTTGTKYHCVDLRTGEELWVKTFLNNASISFGQLLYWQSMNYQGTFAYLWVTETVFDYETFKSMTNWYAFDAYSGDWRFTIKDMPSGTTLRDDNGAIYILQTDLTNGWIALWNMSRFCTGGAAGFSSASWGNSVNGQTLNAGAATAAAAAAWEWNATIPTDLPGSVVKTFFGDMIFGANFGGGAFMAGTAPSTVVCWGINLNPENGAIGRVLFNTSWDAPDDWIEGNQSIGWTAYSAEDKVAVLWSKELRQHYGVSLETGKLIWGPSGSQYYMDIYEGTMLTSHLIAYGKLYACGVSGILYCYDIQTGDLLWTYEAVDPYTEMLWNNNWWLGITFIADGKVYVGSGEHSPNQPLPRGAPYVCVNATTGEEIWRINGAFRQTGWGGLAIIGDSVIATMDTYDQRVYAIGKGPSATTVTAGPEVSVEGSSVVVQGMVTDVSPGTNDIKLTTRFPSGVPAVSDANMSDWMLYVYKQYALPADIVGVNVIISVLDPNNNCYEVARTTSDASGFFSATFIPQVPGKYTVIATFEGSGAYYGSYAETAINVEEAPQPTPTATPVPQEPVGTYFTVSTVLIIAAIAIVAFLILRRR